MGLQIFFKINKISVSVFKPLTIILGFGGDIVLAYYTYNRLVNFDTILDLSFKLNGLSRGDLNPEAMAMMKQVYLSSLNIMIYAFLAIHALIYLFFFTKRKFAWNYLKFYFICAIFGVFYFVATESFAGNFTTLLFSPMIVAYIFMAVGIDQFFPKE
ncbi:MAG: hypothetical protein HOE90_15205 [Bacteriovoracaceae bacterium]|jgi:hypothetical protein|nr:hypothetical protein [Bacteriovoracaceae bacterium]